MNNPDTEKSLFIPAGHNNSIIKIMIQMMMMIMMTMAHLHFNRT